MEVGARTAACTAYIADGLSLFNLRPSPYASGKSSEVSVVGPGLGTMVDLNKPAIAAPFPACIGDLAVRYCSDRRSPFGGKVDSPVWAPDLEDRMKADMGEG